jgi:hypothetical protein
MVVLSPSLPHCGGEVFGVGVGELRPSRCRRERGYGRRGPHSVGDGGRRAAAGVGSSALGHRRRRGWQPTVTASAARAQGAATHATAAADDLALTAATSVGELRPRPPPPWATVGGNRARRVDADTTAP